MAANDFSSTVSFEGKEFVTITEGKVTILFPSSNEVFYNPVQVFNRDMSVAVIKTWQEMLFAEWAERDRRKAERKAATVAAQGEKKKEKINEDSKDDLIPCNESLSTATRKNYTVSILEALAATGLRSIRYAKEIQNISLILANDLEEDAVKSIKRNIEYNAIPTNLVQATQSDANLLMYKQYAANKTWDVIDLDPYGTASPFIDASILSISDGGLLCVTCTDLQVLAGGNYPESGFVKYGGMPLKSSFCHEMALRLVLNQIMTTAARHRKYIVPLVSCSIDFYVRIFVRVFKGAETAKLTASKLSHVYVCNGCKSYNLQAMGKAVAQKNNSYKFAVAQGPVINRECDHCGSTFQMGGPIYNGPLHNKDFVKMLINHVKDASEKGLYSTHGRMLGMLTVISEEIDAPLYWTLKDLTSILHCNSISLINLCSAIYNAGYESSVSHACSASVKTNAPANVIWDIMRVWVKNNPVKEIKTGTPQENILAIQPSIEVSFTYNKRANPESRKIKLSRFPLNPEKNWGPKARAGKRNLSNKRNCEANDNGNVSKKLKGAARNLEELEHKKESEMVAAEIRKQLTSTSITAISKSSSTCDADEIATNEDLSNDSIAEDRSEP